MSFLCEELLNSFIMRFLMEQHSLFGDKVVECDLVRIDNPVGHVDGVILLLVF